MADLGPYPELGWSHSRSRTLGECERRYYLTTYGSWWGWEPSAEPEARFAYTLKQLVPSAKTRVGTLIHTFAQEVVQAVVQRRELPDWKILYERGCADLATLRNRSVADFVHSPKRHPLLLASWSGDAAEVTRQIEEAREHLYQCILSLLDAEVLEEIARCTTEQVILTDVLDSTELRLAGGQRITIWAAPDVAYWDPDQPGRLVLLDWKSGSIDGAEDQLAAYALYVHHRHDIRIDPGAVVGRVVTLSPYADRTLEITPDQIRSVEERIREDVDQMRSLQADRATNRPVAREHFRMLDSGQMKRCRWCSFAPLCAPLRGSTQVELQPVGAGPAGGDDDFVDLLGE